jgi:hypothetical protein
MDMEEVWMSRIDKALLVKYVKKISLHDKIVDILDHLQHERYGVAFSEMVDLKVEIEKIEQREKEKQPRS